MEQNQKLTKTNRPDKRSETSKANAEKARLKKLEKLAEKKRMIQIEVETDDYSSDQYSDSDESSDSDEEVLHKEQKHIPKKNSKRRVGRPTKEEELKQKQLVEAITDATARAIKQQELERKAVAKAKREAIRKAKADGTYVNKGRGRPFKSNQTLQNVVKNKTEKKVVNDKTLEQFSTSAENKTNNATFISW